MLDWFNTTVRDLAKESAHIGAHGVEILVLLAVELGLEWLLALPQLKSIAPGTEPILKAAIPVTVILFCLRFVFIQGLNTLVAVRSRVAEDKIGWWTALGILVTLLLIGYGYNIVSGSGLKLPLTDSKKASAEVVIPLDLTKLDQRSSLHSLFQCPEWADQIELQFRVPVEEGYTYLSQIDHKEVASIGFHPEGMFIQKFPRGSLSDGPHRLTIYRYRLGDKPQIAQIKSISFEIQNVH